MGYRCLVESRFVWSTKHLKIKKHAWFAYNDQWKTRQPIWFLDPSRCPEFNDCMRCITQLSISFNSSTNIDSMSQLQAVYIVNICRNMSYELKENHYYAIWIPNTCHTPHLLPIYNPSTSNSHFIISLSTTHLHSAYYSYTPPLLLIYYTSIHHLHPYLYIYIYILHWHLSPIYRPSITHLLLGYYSFAPQIIRIYISCSCRRNPRFTPSTFHLLLIYYQSTTHIRPVFTLYAPSHLNTIYIYFVLF